MFLFYAIRKKDLLVPPALFSLSWICALGLSCLKLSELQVPWETETWFCFYLIYLGFCLGDSGIKSPDMQAARESSGSACKRFFSSLCSYPVSAGALKSVVIGLTAVSLFCFLLEAFLLGFIPLFTEDTPHAYSTFHISGLHYFTVLCVLVPPFFIAFNELNRRRADVVCILCLVISLMLPILMVSRFQLIFSLILAIFVFVLMHETGRFRLKEKKGGLPFPVFAGITLRPRKLLLLIFALILFLLTYMFLTVERAHSVDYLNGIFEMKNGNTPIFITQPYIYITNNFDNFNALIRELPEHSRGLKMLFPVFALTGLKFIFPELVNYPIFTTKEELTTVTLFYDCWYDFGTFGCFVFALLLGLFYAFLYQRLQEKHNVIFIILYAQLLAYLCLAFFTTWFSNPATWFYLGVTIVVDLFLWYTQKNSLHERKES